MGPVVNLLKRQPGQISDLIGGKTQFDEVRHSLAKGGLQGLEFVDVGDQRDQVVGALLLFVPRARQEGTRPCSRCVFATAGHRRFFLKAGKPGRNPA